MPCRRCLGCDPDVSVALGHPVGASGARIVLQLLHTLRANGGRRGIAAICISGGQGGAMLIETVT